MSLPKKHGPRKVVTVDLNKSPYEQEIPLHNRWHPDIPAVDTVTEGEFFRLECFDAIGGEIGDTETAEDVASCSFHGFHFMSGPVCVVDKDGVPAKPGDILKVEICDIGTLEGAEFAFTASFANLGFLADYYPYFLKCIWDIEGIWATSKHIPGIKVPGLIHPGVLGTAPSKKLLDIWNERETKVEADGEDAFTLGSVCKHRPMAVVRDTEEALLGLIKEGTPEFDRINADAARTIPGRENGGNVDIKNLSKGSSVYFPVFVEGGNLSCGDLHFSEADGEIALTAMEMAGFVDMKCFIIRDGMGKYMTPVGPHKESVNPIFEIGPVEPSFSEWLVFEGLSVDESGRQHYLDATVAFKRAVLNAINYLAKFGYTKDQLVLMLSAVPCEGRISGIVDVPNACCTFAVPIAIFDQDIRPVSDDKDGPKLVRKQRGNVLKYVPPAPDKQEISKM